MDIKKERGFKSDNHRFEPHHKNIFIKKAELGKTNRFFVDRITDIGYLLVLLDNKDVQNFREKLKESDYYFLHNNETNHRELKIDEEVDAFVYLDKQRRIACTLMKPYCDINRGALCEVVNVNETGAYVNIGISKDILFSSDEYNVDTMPRLKNDGTKTMLPVRLRIRGNNIFIKLLSKNEMFDYKDGTPLNVGDSINAWVYRITGEGINLVDCHYNIIFVHKSNLRQNYHLGEEVKLVIIGATDEDYYGSAIVNQDSFLLDSQTYILQYLKTHNGVMNYSSSTNPDIIMRVFNMSKGAFKKALGNLYKQRLVILEDDRTILTEEGFKKINKS